MTLVLFNCPRPAEPPTVNRPDCPEAIGQIQRIVLQRAGFVFDAGGTPTPNSIKELASWTALQAATDDTKIAITPYLEGFTIGKGEALKEGGNDNSTIDGVEVILGLGFGPALGFMKNVPVKVLDQLRLWMSEAYDPAAVVWYGFNHLGKIVCKDLNPAVTTPGTKQYGGLPLQSLVVTEPDNQGLNTRDTADFGFSLAPGWTEGRAIITPNFSVRTQLQAPAFA